MRVLTLALAFFVAQFAPDFHGLHEEHDLVPHCTDGEEATHFCKCHIDHEAPECEICALASHGSAVESPSAVAHVAIAVHVALPSAGIVEAPSFRTSTAPRGPPSVRM